MAIPRNHTDGTFARIPQSVEAQLARRYTEDKHATVSGVASAAHVSRKTASKYLRLHDITPRRGAQNRTEEEVVAAIVKEKTEENTRNRRLAKRHRVTIHTVRDILRPYGFSRENEIQPGVVYELLYDFVDTLSMARASKINHVDPKTGIRYLTMGNFAKEIRVRGLVRTEPGYYELGLQGLDGP